MPLFQPSAFIHVLSSYCAPSNKAKSKKQSKECKVEFQPKKSKNRQRGMSCDDFSHPFRSIGFYSTRDNQPVTENEDLASCIRYVNQLDRVVCSGSFVPPWVVITAAHCFGAVPYRARDSHGRSSARPNRWLQGPRTLREGLQCATEYPRSYGVDPAANQKVFALGKPSSEGVSELGDRERVERVVSSMSIKRRLHLIHTCCFCPSMFSPG